MQIQNVTVTVKRSNTSQKGQIYSDLVIQGSGSGFAWKGNDYQIKGKSVFQSQEEFDQFEQKINSNVTVEGEFFTESYEYEGKPISSLKFRVDSIVE